MTLDELKNSTRRPFSNFESVSDAKALGFIGQKYNELFTDKCRCGSEMVVRLAYSSNIIRVDEYNSGVRPKPSITAVTCCNPDCYEKLPFQLVDMFSDFDVKGIGIGICTKVVAQYIALGKTVSLKDIILNKYSGTGLTGAEYETWCKGIDLIYNSKQTFGKLVDKLAYPHIGSRFEDVFRGCSCVPDFIRKVNSVGLIKLLESNGIKSTDMQFYFCKYIMDIVDIVTALEHTLVLSTNKFINLCMTGKMSSSVGNFTKDGFVHACIEIMKTGPFAGEFELKTTSSVSQATFVIAGANSVSGNTNKYRQAKTQQESSEYRFLFSPDEFLKYIGGIDEL